MESKVVVFFRCLATIMIPVYKGQTSIIQDIGE